MQMEKEVLVLNLDDILPNRFQPRIKFNEKNILELADSIKEHGVIQPIVVRKIGDKYEIIAGERRYKASILAGKQTIPAIVTNLDDKDSAEIALIENVQRQDLTPIEEAVSYKKILDMGYLNQATLAEKLGKTQSTIANKLRLLNLIEEVQEALLEEKISERHARSLLKLNEKDQVMMLNRILNERMTVRKTDDEITKFLSGGINSSEIEQIQEEKIDSLVQISNEPEAIEILNFDTSTQIGGENNMNQTIQEEMNIPSSPIIEEPSPVEEIVTPEIGEIHPGFVDVDRIQTQAQDIYQPQPVEIIPEEPVIESIEIKPITPVEAVQIYKEPEEPIVGNRFFTMFNRPEENKNYVEDIEKEAVNMNVAQPESTSVFNFNPFQPQPEATTVDETPETTQVINESPQYSPLIQSNAINPMAFQSLSMETNEFIKPVNPYTLTDDEEFTEVTQEPTIPEYQPEPVRPVPMEDEMNSMNISEHMTIPTENINKADLKTVINTIRRCTQAIEDMGYVVDTEELDFEDHYEVTFKINK